LELEKATKRELQQTKKLLQQKEKEEKQAQVKAVKDAEVAKRQVEKQRKKQAYDTQKALQQPKTGKQKALQSTAPRKKQNRSSVGGGSPPIAHDHSPTPPQKFNSRSRKIALLKRFQ
jgi:hypothetical protein